MTGAEVPEKETSQRTAAVDDIKLSFNQPTDTGCLVVIKDAGRRDFFELLLQIFREFDWCEGFANRHFAL